jgi:sulfide:quinone oxidoreductase
MGRPAAAPSVGAMASPAPLRPRSGRHVRVAVVGGGFAAAEALVALRTLAGDRVALDLVAAGPELMLRPLAVAAPFGADAVRGVPLADLCADHRATLHQGTVTFVDVPGRRLETDRGEVLEYDAAILAPGGRTRTTIDGALVFDGARGIAELRRLLGAIREHGEAGPVVFAVPGGVSWALPAYELALLTQARLAERAQVAVVTPEHAPLDVFGPAASERVRGLLTAHGIALHTSSEPVRLVPAGLLTSQGVVTARHVVALPRVEGARLPGVPVGPDGFIPIDEHGLVDGTATVYAAGDATSSPVKQGGLATQQADAAAAAIAARAGAPVDPDPFRPVLRAMLLTGALPVFLRGAGAGAGVPAGAADAPLWRPAGKVAARYLGPWLRDRTHARLGTAEPFADLPSRPADPADHAAALDLALTLADDEAASGEHGRALAWLDAAEAIEGALPPAYADRRRRWTLGEPKVARTVGEPW